MKHLASDESINPNVVGRSFCCRRPLLIEQTSPFGFPRSSVWFNICASTINQDRRLKVVFEGPVVCDQPLVHED